MTEQCVWYEIARKQKDGKSDTETQIRNLSYELAGCFECPGNNYKCKHYIPGKRS